MEVIAGAGYSGFPPEPSCRANPFRPRHPRSINSYTSVKNALYRYRWQTQKANFLDLRTVNNYIGGTIFPIVPLLPAANSVCDCIAGQFGKLSHLIKEFASSIYIAATPPDLERAMKPHKKYFALLRLRYCVVNLEGGSMSHCDALK
jgi:hypothetical protein